MRATSRPDRRSPRDVWAAMVAADARDASSDELVSGARHIAQLSRHTATPDVARELS